jgi:myo-inositol-1(or 4)-monophosphatase
MTRLREGIRSTREFAVELAQRAGAMLLEIRKRGLADDEIRTKKSPLDLLTVADLASEQLIEQGIRERFPEHGIYAEEAISAQDGSDRLPVTEWLWLVDPLDGTTNYAHGLGLYAVNIALTHLGKPVLGVTYEPVADRVFWAERYAGAWLRTRGHDERLHVSATPDLQRALLATGFPIDRRTNRDNNLGEFVALEMRVHAVRRLGSAALELALLTGGALDGYWEGRLHPWDWAAGWLLVSEAGGRVTDYAGKTWELGDQSMIASNGQPAVHRGIQETIAITRASNGLAA